MNVSSPCLLGILPSGSEWWIILLVILVLFGGSRIPTLARGLGKGITEFKRGLKDRDEDEEDGQPKPPAPTQTGT